MRIRTVRRQVALSDLSHDWGQTRGALLRQPGEGSLTFLVRVVEGNSPTLAKVLRYAAAMERGEPFPPTFVVEANGQMLLVDGAHRARAAAVLGLETIDAAVARAGSVDEASDIAEAFWECERACDFPSDRRGWARGGPVTLAA